MLEINLASKKKQEDEEKKKEDEATAAREKVEQDAKEAAMKIKDIEKKEISKIELPSTNPNLSSFTARIKEKNIN